MHFHAHRPPTPTHARTRPQALHYSNPPPFRAGLVDLQIYEKIFTHPNSFSHFFNRGTPTVCCRGALFFSVVFRLFFGCSSVIHRRTTEEQLKNNCKTGGVYAMLWKTLTTSSSFSRRSKRPLTSSCSSSESSRVVSGMRSNLKLFISRPLSSRNLEMGP